MFLKIKINKNVKKCVHPTVSRSFNQLLISKRSQSAHKSKRKNVFKKDNLYSSGLNVLDESTRALGNHPITRCDFTITKRARGKL